MKESNVVELLRVSRERAKISQQELARLLFVDQAIVSKVENGKLQPSYTLVKAWSEATGGAELLGMHFLGYAGWSKLMQYEEKMQKIKDLVSYFVVKLPNRREKSLKK